MEGKAPHGMTARIVDSNRRDACKPATTPDREAGQEDGVILMRQLCTIVRNAGFRNTSTRDRVRIGNHLHRAAKRYRECSREELQLKIHEGSRVNTRRRVQKPYLDDPKFRKYKQSNIR